MGKLLLALLKLLLQLAIFALTGQWPRFGEGRQPPSKRSRPRPTEGQQGQRKQPRATQRPRRVPEQAEALSYEQEGTFEEPAPPLEGVATDAAGRPIFVRRRPAPRARPVTPGAIPRRSFASAVRDPRTVRDAVVLDALFGARRPRR